MPVCGRFGLKPCASRDLTHEWRESLFLKQITPKNNRQSNVTKMCLVRNRPATSLSPLSSTLGINTHNPPLSVCFTSEIQNSGTSSTTCALNENKVNSRGTGSTFGISQHKLHHFLISEDCLQSMYTVKNYFLTCILYLAPLSFYSCAELPPSRFLKLFKGALLC